MKTRTLGLAAALALTLAACAEGDDDVASVTAGPTPTEISSPGSAAGNETDGGTGDAADDTTDDESDDRARPDEGIDLNGYEFEVSLDDALEIARSESGAEDPYKVAMEWSDGAWQWEIDLTADGQEWEFEIDATTGEIRDFESDSESDAETPLDLDSVMGHHEAMETAVAERPGRVTDWELKRDDGRQVYEVEIDDETEVKIDADTGEIMEVDD